MATKQANKKWRTKAAILNEYKSRENKQFNKLMADWPAPKKNEPTLQIQR